ncbi:unnamed protein product [Oreochromis niloticus]|nr:unnamed protein product [Mustela putorius furo]
MSSAQYLREFIKERLTAVCEEIFSEVQKTIVQYEEEINRQHRLLDISRKPDRNSHIIDLPHHHDCEEEEGLYEQQVCNQESNSSLDQEDPEPPQVKEEQEELCRSQEGEQLGLKQEAEGIIVWTDEEQLRLMETIWEPVIKLHRIDFLQEDVCEEEVLADQQVCTQERNSSLDEEDPEPPQIKEEQEEVQLGLKQEADTFVVNQSYEENDHSEPEPNSEQLLSHSSPEPESRDHEESQHVDSGSTRNEELKKRRRYRKRRHSKRVGKESQSKTERKMPLKCETCGKTFEFISCLAEHLEIHASEKMYSCSTCGKKFDQKSALDRHLTSYLGQKMYSCSICGKKMHSKAYMPTHMRLHTGEKPYSCSTCGKRFNQKTALKTHIRRHTGEKRYSCSTCGKGFILKAALERHIRCHTGEKPYVCMNCEKRFADKTALDRHSVIHTGEKPYCCNSCGKKFNQSANLKKHMMRIHTG